uniref:Uncharacterized protein n=1 Tax=Cuerna arida TaxID=1464854 RepID=A0A1B6G3Z7_9HEMI
MTPTTRQKQGLTADKSVKVFWLPKEVSQSHGQGTTPETDSKACTLIAVLLIHNCYRSKVEFSTDNPSTHLLSTFSQSIEEGNKIYGKLRDEGMLKVKYLNIPEALTAIKPSTVTPVVEWESFFYDGNMQETLYKNLSGNLERWYKRRPPDAKSDANVVVLANLRAVVLLFSQKKGVVTLMDSHGHCPYGAVIALVTSNSLETLCRWYAEQLTRDTGPVLCYELSFIYCM